MIYKLFSNLLFLDFILALPKYQEDSTEGSHIPLTQFPLSLTSYMSMVHRL